MFIQTCPLAKMKTQRHTIHYFLLSSSATRKPSFAELDARMGVSSITTILRQHNPILFWFVLFCDGKLVSE